MIVKILKALSLFTIAKRIKDRHNAKSKHKNQVLTLKSLYAPFVKAGSLVFDCGGAYGDRTDIFLKLGARKVVLIEPLEYYQKELKRRFRNKNVSIEQCGIGYKPEIAQFYECSTTELSTFDYQKVLHLSKLPSMQNLEWLPCKDLPITTLDILIAKHGVPDFIKIDIEGYDYLAVRGLSKAVGGLSFEYHTNTMDRTIEAIRHISNLGDYEFTWSQRELFQLNFLWLSSTEMIKRLEFIPLDTEFGDIYARLKQ